MGTQPRGSGSVSCQESWERSSDRCNSVGGRIKPAASAERETFTAHRCLDPWLVLKLSATASALLRPEDATRQRQPSRWWRECGGVNRAHTRAWTSQVCPGFEDCSR